ncbi:hypothetical protein DPV73_02930 [Leptospira mayottensis]|nr:hypothetical protein DPV73_02930 [Leptospira mayottensis]
MRIKRAKFKILIRNLDLCKKSIFKNRLSDLFPFKQIVAVKVENGYRKIHHSNLNSRKDAGLTLVQCK